MGEDMTYTAEPTRAQLAQRVQELRHEFATLEAKLLELAQTNGRLASHNFEQRRENAELRARLDAAEAELAVIPYRQLYDVWHSGDEGYILRDADDVAVWLAKWKLKQPADDTDAPLTLAGIDDEDGDL